MHKTSVGPPEPNARRFYRRALIALCRTSIPFLVGGAFALARYTGVPRNTKDFDIFVHPDDIDVALAALSGAGYETTIPFPHWLAKAHDGGAFLDVIFSSGNGIIPVEESWFHHAVTDRVLGLPLKLVAPEEMIWSKAFIMERERFDGADVAHLIRARADSLDWPRLSARFSEHWEVLLAHLTLFSFIYPSERHRIPAWLFDDLLARAAASWSAPPGERRICRGTLLSRAQYLVDVERWGYEDPRLTPSGSMTREDAERWTAAIKDDGPAG